MTGKRRRSPLGLTILGIFLLLDLILAALLLNRWQLRVQLLGDAVQTVEFGEAYQDPGAEAVFGGEHIRLDDNPFRQDELGDLDDIDWDE